MKEETKQTMEIVVNALIERFEDLEELTGNDFLYPKRIILKWAKEKELFIIIK